MGLIAKGTTPPVGNRAPIWNSTPNPSWDAGIGGTYDLTQDVTDADGDSLTFVLSAGTWPTGVSMSSAGIITATSSVVAGTTTGLTVTADDGTASPVASSSFSVVINAVSGLQYPLLGSCRQGNLNYTQTGAGTDNDRKAMGLMDTVMLGGFFGTFQDTADPSPNYISRVAVTQAILDSHTNNIGNSDIYVWTYLNQMETGDDGSDQANKINSEVGPNGTDWWFRDAAGLQVGTWPSSYGVNITDQVTVDAQGRYYPEWYCDVRVIGELIQWHSDAGIGFGQGGMNGYWDNLGMKYRKSGVDPDQDGNNNDMGDWYDPEDPTHMSGLDDYGQPRSEAVGYIQSYRQNQIDALKHVQANTPTFLCGGNTNQFSEEYGGPVSGLRTIIKEYRVTPGDTSSDAWTQSGFSENNTYGPSGYPRSGVWSDNTYVGAGGTWQKMYNNAYLPATKLSSPGIVIATYEVECMDSPTKPAGGKPVYNPIPASNSNWSLFRWGFVTSQLCGAYCSISGIHAGQGYPGSSGKKANTPLFDEYGLINGSTDYGFGSSTTKLFYKWMGDALDNPQTQAKADGSWQREFDNALIVLNPDNNVANAAMTVDVSAFPGGATEWKRFNGVQDSTTNDGTDASSDFSLNPCDAIVLVRKSWYDAL